MGIVRSLGEQLGMQENIRKGTDVTTDLAKTKTKGERERDSFII